MGGNGFTEPANYPEVFRVERVLGADLDGDDAPEIVAYTGGAARIYRNDGTGAFTPANEALAVYSVWSFFLVDVDGDTDLDLVGGSALWLNDGDAVFTAGQSLPSSVSAAGDFDADGDVDFAGSTGSTGGASVRLSVFDNDGMGVFTPRHAGVSTLGGYGTTATVTADFDADGTLDTAITSYGFTSGGAGGQFFSGVNIFSNRGFGGYDTNASGVPDSCE